MAPYENTRKRSPQKAKDDAAAARRANVLALYGPANATRIKIVPSDTGEGFRTVFPRENSLVDWTSASAPPASGSGQPATATEGDADTKSEKSRERSLTPTPSHPFRATTPVQESYAQLSREATIRAYSPGPGIGEGSRQQSGTPFEGDNLSVLVSAKSSAVVFPSASRKELLKAERKAAREEAKQLMKDLSHRQAEVSKQIKLTESNLTEMQARMAALEKKKVAMAGMLSSLNECGDGTESQRGSDCAGTISTLSTCDDVVMEAGYEGSTTTSHLNLMDERDLIDGGKAPTGSVVPTRIIVL